MAFEPEINIAIPTYNRADMLRLSLDSALAQDYENFRITILDNTSTDDTQALVNSYADKRITYIRNKKNIGQFRNWNRAIEINECSYIMILQDDDLIHPPFVRKSLAALERHPQAAFSFVDISEIDESGNIIQAQRQTDNFPEGLLSGTDYLRRIVAGDNLIIHASSVVMTSTGLDAVGHFDTTHSKTSIDFNLYFRLAAQFDLVFVAEDLASIRRHAGAYHMLAEADTRPLAMLGERADAAAFLLKSSAAEDEEFRHWLAERLMHLSMRRSEMTSQLLKDFNLSTEVKRQIAAEEIIRLVPEGERVILVDEGEFGAALVPRRQILPYLEKDGEYWGPPPDNESAISELERMRHEFSGFMIFLWPAFWWFDYYHGLRDHLFNRYSCVLSNNRLIAFDLRKKV